MSVGILSLQVQLPGCKSLKEKRSRIKPLVSRLHKEFNVSIAELEQQNDWDTATLGCALIGNDTRHIQSYLQTVIHWLNKNWPDIILIDDHIEIVS